MKTNRVAFMDTGQIKPLHDFVVLENLEHDKGEKRTASGIIMPESALDTLDKQYWSQGLVISVPPKVTELSQKEGRELKANHIVLFSTGHGVTFTLDDEPQRDYRMVDYENIYSILSPVVPEMANCEEKD
jgi:co-chaperonin GroES (HSP10)